MEAVGRRDASIRVRILAMRAEEMAFGYVIILAGFSGWWRCCGGWGCECGHWGVDKAEIERAKTRVGRRGPGRMEDSVAQFVFVKPVDEIEEVAAVVVGSFRISCCCRRRRACGCFEY